MPLVSIVTPSFNQGRFLQKNLESVSRQDHDLIEHIVVDGGSTDNTISILEQAHYPYPKQLIWSSAPDDGQSDAINKGFSSAKGSIIGWLNSDDLYLPQAISRIVRFFEHHPEYLMVYGEAVWVDAQGTCIDRYPTRFPLNAQSLRERCCICQPSVFFRKNIFDKIGFLDETLITTMDYDYWIRAFKSFPDGIGYLPEYLACSRIHDECKTVALREKVYIENIEIIFRHFHSVPVHWLSSYIDDCLGNLNVMPKIFSLPQNIHLFLQKFLSLVGADLLESLKARLSADRRLALMSDFINVNVSEDGWVGKECMVTIRKPNIFSRLEIEGIHERPVHEPITIKVELESFCVSTHVVSTIGVFSLSISLDTLSECCDFAKVKIYCQPTFVPAHVTHDSTDERQLGVRISNLALTPR